VIHRDVKPENVLLSKTGAKLADFGVAHLPDSMITQRNVVLGTPSYTAPEALATADYGPASDQFSLAATLYESISGARAFAGDDAMDVAKKITIDDPPPVEGLDADPRIVARINGVLRRGLAKEKIERYATADDFGSALAIAIESRAITEQGPSSASRVTAPQRGASAPIRTPIAGSIIETPIRPSLIIRKKTHRAQNLFAALGLLVILGLIVFGRHNSDEAPPKDAPSASASTEAAPSTKPTHNVVPVVPVKKQAASASPSASASAAASPSASASAAASASAPPPASASARRNRLDPDPVY
jgi:serine/threonine-protein kinase